MVQVVTEGISWSQQAHWKYSKVRTSTQGLLAVLYDHWEHLIVFITVAGGSLCITKATEGSFDSF